MEDILKRISKLIWGSLLIGVTYTLSTFFLCKIMTKVGMPFQDTGAMGNNRFWFLVMAIILGFVLGSISGLVQTSKTNQFMAWTILLTLNSFSITMEGLLLAPQFMSLQAIPALLLVQFIASLIASILVTFLFSPKTKQPFGPYFYRPWSNWVLRIAACIGLSSIFFYLFGTVNYKLMSQLYFQTYHISLSLPPAETVLAIVFIRSILVVLSLLTLIMTVGATKRYIAVICGITMVIIGATTPFLQLTNLPLFLLLASSGKIFFQNFTIGVFVGLILGYPSQLEEDNITIIEFLRQPLRDILLQTADFFNNFWQLLPFVKKQEDEGEPPFKR